MEEDGSLNMNGIQKPTAGPMPATSPTPEAPSGKLAVLKTRLATIRREQEQYTAAMSAQVNQQIGLYNGIALEIEHQITELEAEQKG